MDAANVDLKAFTEGFYHRLCTGRLQPVLETLVYLKRETKVWLEVTTLLIPGENDAPAEIAALSDWFAANLGPEVPLHFTAFHPDYKMLDHAAHPGTDPARGTARSPWRGGCATSTPATSTTRAGRRPTATPAVRS